MSAKPATNWLEDVTKEPISWAVPDYIPRRVVSSLYAPRNAGKTIAAIWWATEAARIRGLRIWFNSREDDLPTVLKPRFDAAGAAGLSKQVRLTAEPWRLPADLGAIRRELELSRAGGTPNDMLILDSIQQHVTKYHWNEPCRETMMGLREMAVDFDMAVLLIGHTTKGKHASVEAMIAGAQVLQNLSKAIYVYGPEPVQALMDDQPDEDANPRFVLACERLGVGPAPVSVLLEQRTRHDPVTGRPEPYLTYAGPSDATAASVVAAAKTDERDSGEASKTAQTAFWIVDTLTRTGPMPTKDFEAQAKGDGRYHSRNTFDRARKVAGVETHQAGGCWWACLKDQWPPDDTSVGLTA